MGTSSANYSEWNIDKKWSYQVSKSGEMMPSSIGSSRPVMLRAPSQLGSNLIAQSAGKPAAGVSNQNDAASSSQVWL